MARPRTEKKPDPVPPAARTVLPMQLQVGDRFVDETGEWEVVNRPHTTAGGKIAHARARKVDQPATVEELSWGTHERVSLKRATAQEGNR